MNVKITIEDASPKELALLLNNLNTLDTDSTMTVSSKTKSFNLGDKGRPAEQTEADPATEEESAPAAEETKAPPAEKQKRQSSRKPKEEVEKEVKADTGRGERPGRDSERGGRDDERTSDAADERRLGGRGNLLEKAGEKAKELAGLYRDPKRGEEVVLEILKVFGVSDVQDLAPADFSAAIEQFQRKIDKD